MRAYVRSRLLTHFLNSIIVIQHTIRSGHTVREARLIFFSKWILQIDRVISIKDGRLTILRMNRRGWWTGNGSSARGRRPASAEIGSQQRNLIHSSLEIAMISFF